MRLLNLPKKYELDGLPAEVAEMRWQSARWKRLKRIHNIDHVKMRTRHFFMSNEIRLIRGGNERLYEIFLQRSKAEEINKSYKEWIQELQLTLWLF